MLYGLGCPGPFDNAMIILHCVKKAETRIVSDSARIKAGVVSRDEFETKGERMILNYGHTFGHALEAAGNYKALLHGEGVAL